MFDGAVDKIWEFNMRRIILTTAAIVIFGTTSAFAGGFNVALIGQTGIGDLPGLANQAVVDQRYTEHSSADVGQAGAYNASGVYQVNGKYNAAVVRQYGLENQSLIVQYGPGGNGAETVQYGGYNQAIVVQGGINSTAIVVQDGIGNQAFVAQ